MWDQRTEVINLDEVVRQDKTRQREFIETLAKVRLHKVDSIARRMLQERVLGSAAMESQDFTDAIILVRRHLMRRKCNEERAKATCKVTGHILFNWACRYQYKTQKDRRPKAKQIVGIREASPLEHSAMESLLYLHLGMPVMVTHNLHTNVGITNGALGWVRHIGLTKRDRQRLHGSNLANGNEFSLNDCPEYVIVELKHPNKSLPKVQFETDVTLPENCIAIYPKAGTASVKRQPGSWKFTSLPLTPAYALTDYKSQGQTFDKVIVDLALVRGLSPLHRGSACTMLSRVKTKEGLAILRLPDEMANLNGPAKSAAPQDVTGARIITSLERKLDLRKAMDRTGCMVAATVSRVMHQSVVATLT